MYSVKEIYYTLQGEGAHTGRSAVFLRFSGCNLWTGRERDRHKAVCQFCDTDFIGTDGPNGGRFSTAAEVVEAVLRVWKAGTTDSQHRFVVCTGGEPLLQVDAPLLEALHQEDFTIAVETNGTQAAPPGLDWICVSPKAGAPLQLVCGSELKLVFPQPGAMPEAFEHLEFEHFFLQPMDGPDVAANTAQAIQYCLRSPQWRLSVQTHKALGIS
ncbi:MAG: 7-carboxy-7-deazaguanine synthase [Gemmatimonadota bacterium]